MSKGSKQRPTNHEAYASNHDAIFGGRKHTYIIIDELEGQEACPYCGILTNNPCDEPQNNCEQAINKVHGAWLNDLNSR